MESLDASEPQACRLTLMVCVFVLGIALPASADERKHKQKFSEGVGKVVGAFLLEWPKTIVEVTTPALPLVSAGVLAGTVRASEVAFQGLKEMNETFDPWGVKKSERLRRAGQRAPQPGSYLTPGFDADVK